jgi:hypothetical protein
MVNRVGLPLLRLPICDAFASVLCRGMPERDRVMLLAEIIVIVNHRVLLFQRKQTGQTRYVAEYPSQNDDLIFISPTVIAQAANRAKIRIRP